METVHASKLSRIRMVAGQEKIYRQVIDNGIVKDWVGFGWVDLRDATPADYKKYPTVVRDND